MSESVFLPKRETRGAKRPSYEQIKAFAEAYCIPVGFLLNYPKPNNEPMLAAPAAGRRRSGRV